MQTGIRTPAQLDRAWELVRTEAAMGHRTFVVVPLIEPEGADSDADADTGTDGAEASGEGPDAVAEETPDPSAPVSGPSAESEAARLTDLLAPLRVGMVHGRLKPARRDEVMAAFRDGTLDVLVGTTVIEVGVDVPEATLMIIEGADRFGLAQLHQLRGRVGRGTAKSYCVLVTDAAGDSVAMDRLRAVKDTTDGFRLAELDIELRKEGELLGLRQSGLPPLRVAELGDPRHRAMTREARERAEALVGPDGRLLEGHAALDHELADGWLARIGAGDVLRADEIDA